ncbi:MAG: hypothetical protein ACE361_22490 [Aureliella sp.]
MKRIAFVSLLLICSAGCRGGLLSRLFHGEPCNGTCGLALPAPTTTGCNSCATPSVTSGYPSYEGEYYGGEVLDGTVVDPYYGGVVDGQIIGSSDPIIGSSTTSPSMAPIVNP